MAFPTTPVLDNFNRANGAIGSNWLAGFGDNLPAINSNTAKGAAAAWYGAVWSPSGAVASLGPDVEVYYTVTDVNLAGAQPAAVLARLSTPTTGTYNGYMARVKSDGTPELGRFTAGAFTSLNAGAGVTLTAGDKIGLEIIGSGTGNLRMYYAPAGVWPGTPTVTATDATYTGAGGIATSWNQSGANLVGMDDFGGGTIAAADPTPPPLVMAPPIPA